MSERIRWTPLEARVVGDQVGAVVSGGVGSTSGLAWQRPPLNPQPPAGNGVHSIRLLTNPLLRSFHSIRLLTNPLLRTRSAPPPKAPREETTGPVGTLS